MITLAFILATILVAGYFKAQLDAIADSGIKSDEWKNKYFKSSFSQNVSE